MRIRSKILVPIYTVVIIGFSLVGISIYSLVYENNFKSEVRHLSTYTHLYETHLKNFLKEIEEKLKEISEVPENQDTLKILSKYQGNKETRNYKNALEIIENNISHFQGIYPEIQNIFLIDQFGIIVYALGSKEVYNGEFVDMLYGNGFFSYSKEKLFISDIRLKDMKDKKSSYIFASIPIKSKTGDFSGAVIVETETEQIDALLGKPQDIGESGIAYLVGRDGGIRTNTFLRNKFTTYINTPSFQKCFQQYDTTHEDNGYKNFVGHDVLGSYAYISEIDMCLITEIKISEIQETARYILYILSGSSMIIFLLISGSIFWIVRSITAPLLLLREKMQEVRQGKRNIHFTSILKDEIGDLGKSFQDMLYDLGITEKKIQKKVQEQTREIRKKQKETEVLNKDLLKFQEALKKASDYVAILDKAGRVVYINTSLERETGYKLTECIGKNPINFWRKEEDPKKIQHIWSEIQDSKESKTIEMTTTRNDGSNFISDVHISPILDKHEEIEFFLTIENDITQEKEIKKMKDEFISLVSHELRTPMTVIRGFTKILLNQKFGDINSEQQKYLQRIENNTQQLIHMVNDMLDLDKLNSGKMDFQYEEFDIIELATEIQENLSMMCEEKNISLSIKGNHYLINSDREKIQQVLINLIRNAYKFTPENGSIKIHISKKKKNVLVQVIDTGIGIPEREQEKIFQKFQQVDSQLQKKEKGTGLGLSICELIIAKLGGEIGFDSVYKKGSTFYFTLPYKK